jgi:hypothetical protein
MQSMCRHFVLWLPFLCLAGCATVNRDFALPYESVTQGLAAMEAQIRSRDSAGPERTRAVELVPDQKYRLTISEFADSPRSERTILTATRMAPSSTWVFVAAEQRDGWVLLTWPQPAQATARLNQLAEILDTEKRK